MTSTSTQVDDRDTYFDYTSEEEDHWSSFDEYFETTKEYDLLLTLHRLPPILTIYFLSFRNYHLYFYH